MILTINAGSSSVKFAVFTADDPLRRLASGQVERIGQPHAILLARHFDTGNEDRQPIHASTHAQAADAITAYIRRHFGDDGIAAIGHRVVHGGLELLEHQLITPAVLTELRRAQQLDRSHLPREIALIEAFGNAFARIAQVACFDTAFFHDLPRVSQLLPIPRQFFDAGVRRFGFHGLSYTYLMDRLATVAGEKVAEGRVILAHLGSGASMAAVNAGKPIDTTMAFTPAAGLVMATRPGDLDPGLVTYLMRDQNLSPEAMDDWIASKCGLAGVSQTSGDVRDLLTARGRDPRAADALNLFCYQAKKYLCALAGALGGLDTIVFAGGIGEHTGEIRAAICSGLEFMGIHLDLARNAAGADVVSSGDSRVAVRIIATDEEIVIARLVQRIGGLA